MTEEYKPRLIDANELRHDFEYPIDFSDIYCRRMIDSAPTIDADPVRHAHWISLEPEIGLYACSKCEHKILRAKCNYCPKCGRKMDEEVPPDA